LWPTVGVGHPDGLQRGRRVAVERCRRGGHRRSDARHLDLRHAETKGSFDHQRHRTPGDRIGREIVTITSEPRHAEEQRAGPHLAVVIGEIRDFEIPRAGGSAK